MLGKQDPETMRKAEREVAATLPDAMVGLDTEDARHVARRKRREREG